MSQWLALILQSLATWLDPKPAPAPSPAPTPAPPPAPAPVPPGNTSTVIAEINAARAAAGLGSLAEDATLESLASSWAGSMASSGIMTHGEFAARIATAFPNTAAAEDIAEGQPDAASVVAAWMADPAHRTNLMGPYDKVGVGSSRIGTGPIYWCADFDMS